METKGATGVIQRGSQFDAKAKIKILRRLATATHILREKTFNDAAVRRAVRGVVSYNALEDWKSIRDELLQDGLITRSGAQCAFAHLSFQEFLTARELHGDPTGKRATFFLRRFLDGDGWWKDVLYFYIGLSGNPPELQDWVTSVDRKIGDHSSQVEFLREAIREIYSDSVQEPSDS